MANEEAYMVSGFIDGKWYAGPKQTCEEAWEDCEILRKHLCPDNRMLLGIVKYDEYLNRQHRRTGL